MNASLNEKLGTVKWGEFKLGDLFEVVSYKKCFDANKVAIIENRGHPYIVRQSTENGRKGNIDEPIKYLNPGNTISFGQDTATMFYQEKPYFTGDKIKILKLYIGTGVSGGEEGALKGPSMMPGGSPVAWPYVKPIFQAICAKVEDGSPCCEWVGENGAGHFVKMVHNGIEYGDMQLICEAYQLMRDYLRMSDGEMHQAFAAWNDTELDSYLIEITRDILAYKDVDGSPLVEHILDTAGQKGTGKWTATAALDEGVPLTLISEAVFSRCLSAMKDERVTAAAVFDRIIPPFTGDKELFVENIRQALYASKIISYAQGYTLMRAAAGAYGWNLNYGGIALMWRGGCIIRSAFLGKIKDAYIENPALSNLLLDPYFEKTIKELLPAWRTVVSAAASCGVPAPAMSAALSYFDGYTTRCLPANLLQAQRDYFGAHTYRRLDASADQVFHTNWTGHGGSTAAGTYNV